MASAEDVTEDGWGWQMNKSVLERNKMMLDKQLFTDVNFVFEDKATANSQSNTLKAHKYMLVSSSPVFCSMLTGGLATEEEDILIDDVEYDAFATMLRFIYCEEVDLAGDSVIAIIYAAKKYMIPTLTRRCTRFLDRHLCADNVCGILDQALLFDEKELVEKCLDLVKFQTAEVITCQDFKDLSSAGLGKILECSELSVSEVDVFKACVEWAKYKGTSTSTMSGVDIREKLGPLLYSIRLPVLTAEEFSSVVVTSGVLSQLEEIACSQFISHPELSEDNLLPFDRVKRKVPEESPLASKEVDETSTEIKVIDEGNRSLLVYGDSLSVMMMINVHKNMPGDRMVRKIRISGFRILCEKDDVISFALFSSSSHMAKNPRDRKNYIRLKNELLGEVTSHTIQSVTEEGDYRYSDIHFPDKKSVDMQSEKEYHLKIIFNYTNRQPDLPVETPYAQQYTRAFYIHRDYRHAGVRVSSSTEYNRVYITKLLQAT